MKKTIAFFMSIIYAFSLTTCGDKNDDERSSE